MIRTHLINHGEAPRASRRPSRQARGGGEYRPYLTDEQRRGTGCIGGRMPAWFMRWVLVTVGQWRSWERA